MIIDNGERKPLVIEGVFEGQCGVSRGVLAFLPNRNGRRPEAAQGALLNGDPVQLTEVTASLDGRSYTARFRLLL